MPNRLMKRFDWARNCSNATKLARRRLTPIRRVLFSLCFLGLSTPSLPALTLSGAPLKVACIGDSITEGSGLANPATESYPAKLQRLLGVSYQVRNYGVSGRTLLKKGDFPYWKEAAYVQSRDWNPDIVIIKLGTNDSKPQNWRYGTNFVSDYEEFIGSYTNLPSHPRVLLCTPCPVYGSGAYDISPGVVATNIAPAVRGLAQQFGLELIDLQTSMAGHREWFPDTVHPNSRGTTVLCALVRTALVNTQPDQPPPPLTIARLLVNRAALSWPAPWAGLVLQSAPALTGTNTSWTIVEQVAFNDDALVRVTNTVSGAVRFYRLWQP
jgi:acyl-CoA thioesterase-1